MSKQIFFNKEAQEKLMKGISILYEAVSSTLGPSGRSVIIKNGMEEPTVTQDGVTVAKSIDHNEAAVNLGIQMIKRAAIVMDQISGDGTTTITVLCYNLLKKCYEDINNGVEDIIDYNNGMNFCLNEVIDYIKENKIEASDEQIKQIGAISSNNNRTLGEIAAEAVLQINEFGKVNVYEGLGKETIIKKSNGYAIDLGMASSVFANENVTGFFKAPKAYLLIRRGVLSDLDEYKKIIRTFDLNLFSPLIIIAEDFSTDIMAHFNHSNNIFKKTGKSLCLIKNPKKEAENEDFYTDIYAFTGAEVINKFIDHEKSLGVVNNVVVKQGETIFGESTSSLNNHLEYLKERYYTAANEAVKETTRKRISMLEGGLISIFVGGNSEIEIKEKYYRMQDAVNSCIAAKKHGIVKGGGFVLLDYLKSGLTSFNRENYSLSFVQGYNAVRNILDTITLQIRDNCVLKTDTVEILESSGFDFKKQEHCDMIERGIIDPASTTINALSSAVSIVGTIITTNCVIVE